MNLLDDFTTKTFNFVNYVHLKETDSRAIWEGRNHPDVRKWMTDPKPFSWESHCNYIDSLKSRSDCSYWAAMKDGVVVGSMCLNPIKYLSPNCSFQYLENQNVVGEFWAETGMFLLPEFIGQGMGTHMKGEFIDYILHNTHIMRLLLKTLLTNTRTIKLNEVLGYEKYKEDDTYVYMMLSK